MVNNFPVNRTDFRLVRGVQNEIIFFVRDVDRKPVSLADDDLLTITLVDTANDRLLMQRDLTVVDLAKGIYSLVTLSAEMDTWPSIAVRWSMAYTRADESTVLLWTDQNYSPYSTALITESPYPGPAVAITLLWDDLTLELDDRYYSVALPGSAKDGFTDGLHTLAIYMASFSGTVELQGTVVADPDLSTTSSDWITATSVDYISETGLRVVDSPGDFIWTRVVVTVGTGTIDHILYKN